MSAPGYDALEAVVAAATPGPWRWDAEDETDDLLAPDEPLWLGGWPWTFVITDCNGRHSINIYNRDFIATFDPPMVADLLARARERDAAIAERDRLRDGLEALVQAATLADGDDPIGWVVTDNLRTLLDQTANDGSANE